MATVENTAEETKVVSVDITEKGKDSLLELLQESVGYIEEETHEQIINDIQNWMNENYKYLIEFYIAAIEKQLVPASQHMQVAQENKFLKDELTRLQDSGPDKGVAPDSDEFQKIDEMNYWDLRKLAKTMGIDIKKGMKKNQIYDLVKDKIKK